MGGSLPPTPLCIACVAHRQSGHHFKVIVSKPGVGHARGLERMLGSKLAQRLAAHIAYDPRQQDVAGVAVEIAGTRCKVERLHAAHQFHHVVLGRNVIAVAPAGQIEQCVALAQAAHVMQQVAHRGVAFLKFRQLRHILANGRLERDLTLPRQMHHGRGRELLGDRSGIERGLRRDGNAVFETRQAVAFRESQLALLSHADGAAWSVGRGVLSQDVIDALAYWHPLEEQQEESEAADHLR